MAVDLDLDHLEHQLRGALGEWRRALGELRLAARPAAPSPFALWPALCAAETRRELAALADDPRAAALALWTRALAIEDRWWPARLEQAALWHAPHPELGAEPAPGPSLRQLRRQLMGDPREGRLEGCAAAFTQGCPTLSAAVARGLELRRELERPTPRALEVERQHGGVDGELGARAAARLLDATSAMAAEMRTRHWWQGLRQSFGRDACEGWPATLGARWLTELFRGSAFARVPRVALGALPAAWGATSFARLLGAFGVAVLDAARDRSPEFARHQFPHGVRRHQRFALFATIVAERTFAQRELGLGRARAREHQRVVARAMLRALRLDALRVACGDALAASGSEAAQQCLARLAPSAFGAAPPRALLGVVPVLQPTAARALVAQVLAAGERQSVIARFGEDWYRNPRFGESLRASDHGPLPSGPLDPAALDEAMVALVQAFGEAL